MREIKFRGWSTDFNKWIYGYACFSPNKERAVIIHKHQNNDMQHTDVIPESVGEWTGLKDKSLTEIYEGDIIEFIVGSKTNNPETIRAEIIYPVTDNSNGKKTTHAAFGYNAMVDGEREDFYLTLCDVNILNIGVIGNIHENPNLLTN